MRDATTNPKTRHIALSALGVTSIVACIVATSTGDSSPLGAPAYWAWVLTGLQVMALRIAASGNPAGWLFGASIQLPWITYAFVTAQFGFVPGCLVSAAVQAHGYLRGRPVPNSTKQATYA